MTLARPHARHASYDDTPLETAPGPGGGACLALEAGETLALALKRILVGEIVVARRAVEDASMPRDEAVHRVRRRLKRARSLFFVLEDVPGANRDGRVAQARDVARLLAAARDADVAVAEGRRLLSHADRRSEGAVSRLVARLDAEREAAHRALVPLDEVAARLRACEADARSLPDRFAAGLLLCDALGASYRRGRRDWRALAEGESVEAMHDWRKRVKQRRHLSALVPIATAVTTAAIQRDLEVLGEILGEEHDLAVLQHRLREETDLADDRHDRESLIELVARRRRRLRKKALDLGNELYGPRGRDFDTDLATVRELC